MTAPALVAGEESPGSTGTRCRVTPGGGDPRESATESKPPAGAGFGPCLRVRVKGCGKSAPRRRQRRWHGKPHREQDQVGTTAPVPARVSAQACFRAGRPGRSREARGDTGPRGMAIPRLSGRGQNPAYRPPAPAFAGSQHSRTNREHIRRLCLLSNLSRDNSPHLSTELCPRAIFRAPAYRYRPDLKFPLTLNRVDVSLQSAP